MDPHQRVVLEVGYEACHHAGYSKGKLMNKIGPVPMLPPCNVRWENHGKSWKIHALLSNASKDI
jgi:hypothetical protein